MTRCEKYKYFHPQLEWLWNKNIPVLGKGGERECTIEKKHKQKQMVHNIVTF